MVVSFVCLFLGFHTLGLYVHNDVMQALGSPEKQLALLPVFAEWLQLAHHAGSCRLSAFVTLIVVSGRL